jgi:Flp pilus assembly protein TadB
VHLRMPSIDHGVQAFLWSVVFFLFMWLGALAVGLPNGASFVVSLVIAAVIFLLVRTRGGHHRPRR